MDELEEKLDLLLEKYFDEEEIDGEEEYDVKWQKRKMKAFLVMIDFLREEGLSDNDIMKLIEKMTKTMLKTLGED